MIRNGLLELKGTRIMTVGKYKGEIGNQANFYLSQEMKSFSLGE